MVDSLPLDSDPRRRCIRALRKTCGLYGVLPDSYTITYSLSKSPNQRPFANGGFCDVWRIADETDKKTYAVKSLRVYEEDPVDKINKKYCKEVIVCKRVRHRNILSIEGVAPRLFEFCMVSQWMEHGHILDYVNRYQEVNRLELLIGVTCGLNYLHCNEVVHGDLKSPNILVDGEGTPRLSDFGLCSITKNIDTVNASTPNHGSTVRYCAPELLDHEETPRVEKKKATNKSDVYSYSMVIVELVTGQVPFADSTEYNVVSMVSKGKRPPKPRRFDAPGTSKAVWEVAEKCWHSKPDKRPEVKEALQYLNGINAGGECTYVECSYLGWEN
ncbi:kinase-like domain-containing protein [Thelephora terrestris]|uniref:Kinase-like domain-containing protein n=1 Tax=Thelephora terrestris TaxID=56493 RepID=A0A9P6HLB3_9AGAM|nr:kinase-like domain-containing protein [Thelephora terrestris]